MSDLVIWDGAEVLRQFLIPVADLEPWKENPRQGDVMAIVGSLRRFGQVRAVTTRGDGRSVIAGHHLRLAAIELGWTHVAAIPAEFKSEREGDIFGLADNQLASLGGYDEQKLYEAMEQASLFDLTNLEGTGFDVDRVEDVQAAAGRVPEAEIQEGQDLARGHAEDAQAAAERAATLAASKAMKESVLMLTQEQAKEFGEDIKILGKSWGISSLVQVVLRAVHDAAEVARFEVATRDDPSASSVSPAEPDVRTDRLPDHEDLRLPEEAYPAQEETLSI